MPEFNANLGSMNTFLKSTGGGRLRAAQAMLNGARAILYRIAPSKRLVNRRPVDIMENRREGVHGGGGKNGLKAWALIIVAAAVLGSLQLGASPRPAPALAPGGRWARGL